MIKLIIILSSFLSILLSDRGDLLTYEYIDSRDVQTIQEQLNLQFGGLSPTALYDIDLYAITYETIDQFGQTVVASGLISYPKDISSAFPLLTFQHGTQIRRESAPSMNGFNDLILWLATSGYIFVESDYLGLGVSNMLHPYHLKDVTATTVIDMLRATKHFCDQAQDIQYNNQLYIAGYSEGGYATMAAVKEIEENHTDEFDITISFPMAGAYDLSGTMVDLMLSEEPYADPFYLPYFVLSYIETYALGEISDFFLPEYAEIFPDLFSGEYSGGYINTFLPDIPIHMMLPSVVEEFSSDEDYPFRVHLEENDLWNWTPMSTMYLLHGVADERVPHENSIIAYNQFILNGAQDVSFELLPETFGGHQDAAVYCLLFAFALSEELKQIHSSGDINMDSILNILDIVALVSIIMGNTQTDTSYEIWASDFNIDGIVNVLDVIALLNIILNNE